MKQRVVTLKVKYLENIELEETLQDIGFNHQDHKPTDKEKECVEMLWNLGYFKQ